MQSSVQDKQLDIPEQNERRYSAEAPAMGLVFQGRAAADNPLLPLPLTAGVDSVWAGNFSSFEDKLEGSKNEKYLQFYLVTKRIGDSAAAGAALLLLFPVIVVIALMIRAEGPGPILYFQERVGKNGRRFKFYKFRSMVQNADAVKAQYLKFNEASGPIFKMKNDPRVTRVGRILRRYSLDELPQFWNVLKGDMSLVGPRPHLPAEVAQYRLEQKARLLVQPGLICLREVSGRSHLSFEQWMETDLAYIRSRSLLTDLNILLKSVPAILKADGAF